MSVKSNKAAEHLDKQRREHAHKKWSDVNVRAIVTGALRKGSIGEGIVKMLEENKHTAVATTLDVRDMHGIPTLLKDFNMLVCCHGVTHLDWFENFPLFKARTILDVNLYGTINVVQSFVQLTLPTNERKRIVLIGSMGYRSVLNGSAVYCASKAGLAMFGRCLAWELAPKGFDVFIIHPSNVADAPMSNDTINDLMRYRNLSKEEATNYWNDSPIRGQILNVKDIAGLVKFLCSQEAAYLSGAQLELAGGQR